AANCGIRSYWPSAQRYSIATFCPSTKPISPRPLRNAARYSANVSNEPNPRNPITGIACCARAASGHAAAAPPSSVMNSRRFIHLVGEREQPVRHVEVEYPGCLEVEHELEFGRLHHRQVGRLFALENAPGIDAGLAIGIGDAGSIADQPALKSEFAQRIHGGN